MATAQRYPLSSADGQAIPLEVIKPLGVLVVDFTITGYTAVSIPAAYVDKIFIASSSEDCYISTSASPVSVVAGTVATDIVHVPSTMVVAFVANSTTLNVRGVSAVGRVILQIADTWASLSLEQQVTRI